MSQILYINILVDWSLSGIMTSKHVTRESESPRPAASSILISRMTRSSVIIQYRSEVDRNVFIWVHVHDNDLPVSNGWRGRPLTVADRDVSFCASGHLSVWILYFEHVSVP